ncbi:hypothetical protein ABIB57_004645 [Devosia sp. UYZn731]|uniref:superinfection immunity protein n=1 Tax=Devosia sp. UYZn731 TaxID=3156345 RepID=UPI00339B274A
MPSDNSGYLFIFCVAAIAGAIYLIPTFVAFARRHPNRWLIMVINVAFGGTGIGWLGSLVWAFQAAHLSEHGSDGGESGINLFANDVVPVAVVGQLPVPDGRDSHDALANRLIQLKRLLDAGALTDAEYAAIRQPVLDQLSK